MSPARPLEGAQLPLGGTARSGAVALVCNAMRKSGIASIALVTVLSLGAAPDCRAVEVVGTAYTVLLRGHGPSTAAPAQQQPRGGWPFAMPNQRPAPPAPSPRGVSAGAAQMRLVEARTGQTVASAAYDPAIDGYMFRLPMNTDAARRDGCLVLKTASGVGVPVRDVRDSDDGYFFQNPAWQAESRRLTELASLRGEMDALGLEVDKATRETETLLAQNAGVEAASQCVPGAAVPDPPRPPGALQPADAATVSGPVCAAVWERAFEKTDTDAGRLFTETGFADHWSQRAAARPVAQSLSALRLDLRDNDGRTILDAAAKGRAFLEHAEGMRAFTRVHAACRKDVARLAGLEVQAWQDAIAAARAAPALAQVACGQRIARVQQLREMQGRAATYRRELERRTSVLQAGVPADGDARRIDAAACRP